MCIGQAPSFRRRIWFVSFVTVLFLDFLPVVHFHSLFLFGIISAFHFLVSLLQPLAFAAVRRRAQRVQARARLGAEQADHEDSLVHRAGARLCQGQFVCRVQRRTEPHGMNSKTFRFWGRAYLWWSVE
jgi:hypothetical protein